MPENVMDDKERSDQEPSRTSPEANRGRTSRLLIVLLPVLMACVAVIVGYRYGMLQLLLWKARPIFMLGRDDAVFTKTTEETLFSRGEILNGVGKSPGGASKELPATPVQAAETQTDGKLEAPRPDEGDTVPEKPTPPDQPVQVSVPVGPVAGMSVAGVPKIVETPVIVPREPSTESSAEPVGPSSVVSPQTEKKDESTEVQEEKKPLTEARRRGPVAYPAEKTKRVSERDVLAATVSRRKPQGKTVPSKGKEDQTARDDDKSKGERFQLPGSLVVAIKNYEGSLTKWGLMVILDDSASMAKKTKSWTPSRSQAAETLINKLPEIITPGSRMAVRDFLCKQSSDKQKSGPCLSHLLYEWSGAPFQDLRAKLDKVDGAGQTDPCAAAAYAIKKDMSELGELVPRVLILTSGTAKCKAQDVVKAVDGHKGKEKVRVDVIALGLNKKTQKGYFALAKKADGALLKANAPGEIDQALANYKKILQKKSVEKVEIRGENVVLTGNLGDEIALSPGTYSVVLPLVASLKASNRTIPNVKVLSGETTLVQVKIVRGRPSVRIAKK